MINVLQINAGKNYGGVSSFLLEVYKRIDRNMIQFDFLTPTISTFRTYEDDIKIMGGHIYEFNITGNIIKRKIILFIKLKKFLKDNKYQIIHINSGSFFFNLSVAFYLKLLKKRNIIVHSHNSIEDRKKFKKFIVSIFKPILCYFSDYYFSCSLKAAESMFTSKIVYSSKLFLINNGVDIQKFKFDKEKRNNYRAFYNLGNKLVIGHVGRFSYQKNHEFVLDVFFEIYKKNKNTVLLLIGEGELENHIKQKVKKLNLENVVFFLGLRNDVDSLLNAIDVLLLPSYYEGLPIIAVEAQTSGLKLYASTEITKEVSLSEKIKFLPLKERAEYWANEVLKDTNLNNREKAYKEIEKKRYDIDSTTRQLTELYIKIANDSNKLL